MERGQRPLDPDRGRRFVAPDRIALSDDVVVETAPDRFAQ
jgi:hypothetical protein